METENLILKSENSSQSLSSAIKVAAAIIKKFNNKKFKFYNVNNWENVTELNNKVLPILIDYIDEGGLSLNDEDLFYNIKAFDLLSSNGITDDSISVILKYFDYEFRLKLKLNTDINNEDILLAFKDWSTNNKNYILNLLSFETNDIKILFNKLDAWCDNINKNVILKINAVNKQFDYKVLKIIAIDTEDLKNIDDANIQLFFNYDNNLLINHIFIPVKVISITNDEIKNYFENIINIKNPIFFELKDVRTLFFYKTNFQDLLTKIRNNITNIFEFKNQAFTINLPTINWNFEPVSKKHLKIPSWANEIILPLKCEFYNQEILLDLKIKLIPIVFYEIIKYFESEYDFSLTTFNTGSDILKKLNDNFNVYLQTTFYDNAINKDVISFDLWNKNYQQLVKKNTDKWQILIMLNNQPIVFQKEFNEVFLKLKNIKSI